MEKIKANNDQFGEGYALNLDREKSQMTSYCGVCGSIFLLVIILIYGFQKADVLINKKDVNILQTKKSLHFNAWDKFTYNDGLNVAVALTAFDAEEGWILEKKYGELVIAEYSWGTDENNDYFVSRSRLDTAVCTPEQLGLTEDKSGQEFHPMHQNAKKYVGYYQKKFLCAKKEEMHINGDFNSDEARLINIQLIKCKGTDCASPEEIETFFRGKYLLFFYNQIRFDSKYFHENAIIRESYVRWINVNTQVAQSIPFQVSKTGVFLQDGLLNLDHMTELENM